MLTMRLNDCELHMVLITIADETEKPELQRLMRAQPYIPFPPLGEGGAPVLEEYEDYMVRMQRLAEQAAQVTDAGKTYEQLDARVAELDAAGAFAAHPSKLLQAALKMWREERAARNAA